MAQRRIIDTAGRLLGEPVSDAVMMLHRPRTAFVPFVLMVVPVVLSKGNLWAIGLSGGVAGGASSMLCDYKLVARTSTRLMLLAANPLPVLRPTKVDREINAAEIAFVDKPGINKAVTVDGRQYIVSRLFVSRLQAILGRTG